MNITLRLSICAALIALSACAQRGAPSYAERYSAALERYPGVVQSDGAAVDTFVRYFSGARGGEDRPSTDALYARALYFSDTLLTSEEHAEVVDYLERMHANTGGVQVTLLDTQIDGADVYLVWRMNARFRAAGREVASDTIGVTHLRFDATGRIVLQQDFWDSTEGFYRHLPVVGSLVNSIAARVAGNAR